jgi:hypothetical protein
MLRKSEIDWKFFCDNAKSLMPKTIKDKMKLFLRAFTPQELSEEEF